MNNQRTATPRVFVSYTGADRQLVQAIREGLESNNKVKCFTFEQKIQIGQNIVEEVREQLTKCTHFLSVITKDSLIRPWVRHEINTALLRYLNGECSLLLVSRGIEDSDLPWDLRQFDHLKVVDMGTAVNDVIHAVIGAREPKPCQRWDFWRRYPDKPDVFKLLSWHVRLTKLYGRNGEQDELLAWACQDGDEPRVRIVTGPGGIGKTRLAAELCDRLWQGGWEATFLDHQKDLTPTGLGTLWVVDYPEEKQQELGELFQALGARRTGSVPVRVLMLSRQPEEWWLNNSEVRMARAAHLFDTFDLKLVGLGAEDTVAMFREACGNLCEWYKRREPPVTDDRILKWRQKAEFHAMPLMVVAAALHAVLDPDEALGLMGREVVQSLVQRERNRLDVIGEETARLMGYGPDRVEPTWASRLYGLSAAADGVDANLLRVLAQPELEFGLPEAGRVVELTRRLPIYASHVNPPQVEVPRPDIFGAALLYDVLSDRADMAPNWLWAAFAAGKTSKKEDLSDRLGRLIFDVSTVCATNEQKFSDWLLEMIRMMPERAKLLEPLAKEERPPDAALSLSIEVNRYLVGEEGDPLPIRAARLTQLALHLVRADRNDEAVGPARKAVALLRELGSGDSALRLQLARALRVLSSALHTQQTADEAVHVVEEAVGIFRTLVDVPDWRDELAKGLNEQGIALRMAHRGKDSLAVLQETVEIYRNLVHANVTHERTMILIDSLARGLYNLSALQWELGRTEEALKSIHESVSLRGDLYAEMRWRYGRYFALSLSRLAEYLVQIKDYEHGEEAINQAIMIRRRLVVSNPGQFGVDLVSALSTKASILTNAGRALDAVAAYQEAIRIFHQLMDAGALVADNPTLASLTMTLAGVVGYNAVENHQPDVAIKACSNVVDLIQRVRHEKQEQWGPNLQLNLMAAYLNRGNAHRKTQEGRQCAIADYTRAIEEGQELVSLPNRAPEWVVYLEVSLINRCMERYSENDPAAFDDHKLSVEMDAALRAELGDKWPISEHHQLVKSLKVMKSRLKETKNAVLLSEVAKQVFDIVTALARRKQYEHSPDAIDEQLECVRVILDAGDEKLFGGQPAAAAEQYDSAMRILTDLQQNPATSTEVQRLMATLTNRLGEVGLRQGRYQEALIPFEHALAINESLIESGDTGAKRHEDYAIALLNLADTHAKLGHGQEATNFTKQCRGAVEAMQSDDLEINPELAEILQRLEVALQVG